MSRDVLLTPLLPACHSDAAGAGPGPSSAAANAARAGGGAAAVNAGQSAAAARLFEKVQVLSHTITAFSVSHTVYHTAQLLYVCSYNCAGRVLLRSATAS